MTKKVQHLLWGTGSSTWFITTKQLLLGTNAHSVMATTKNLSCNSLSLVSIICIRSLSPNSVNEKLCSYPHLSNTGMIKWIKATKKLLHSTSNKKFWCEQGKWPLQQSDKDLRTERPMSHSKGRYSYQPCNLWDWSYKDSPLLCTKVFRTLVNIQTK